MISINTFKIEILNAVLLSLMKKCIKEMYVMKFGIYFLYIKFAIDLTKEQRIRELKVSRGILDRTETLKITNPKHALLLYACLSSCLF